MNKTRFIETLADKTGYSHEECEKINQILEDNFFISKQSKDKIICKLCDTFNISEEESERIYNVAKTILNAEVKEKLHGFKDLDKK